MMVPVISQCILSGRKSYIMCSFAVLKIKLQRSVFTQLLHLKAISIIRIPIIRIPIIRIPIIRIPINQILLYYIPFIWSLYTRVIVSYCWYSSREVGGASGTSLPGDHIDREPARCRDICQCLPGVVWQRWSPQWAAETRQWPAESVCQPHGQFHC